MKEVGFLHIGGIYFNVYLVYSSSLAFCVIHKYLNNILIQNRRHRHQLILLQISYALELRGQVFETILLFSA